jgi:hypothetical protein
MDRGRVLRAMRAVLASLDLLALRHAPLQMVKSALPTARAAMGLMAAGYASALWDTVVRLALCALKGSTAQAALVAQR